MMYIIVAELVGIITTTISWEPKRSEKPEHCLPTGHTCYNRSKKMPTCHTYNNSNTFDVHSSSSTASIIAGRIDATQATQLFRFYYLV